MDECAEPSGSSSYPSLDETHANYKHQLCVSTRKFARLLDIKNADAHNGTIQPPDQCSKRCTSRLPISVVNNKNTNTMIREVAYQTEKRGLESEETFRGSRTNMANLGSSSTANTIKQTTELLDTILEATRDDMARQKEIAQSEQADKVHSTLTMFD
ncbi:unnamed protein product [Owenia fusiformis]|uniref:Uncharacterized protein n=1 Tax=Owenia fusiformis TaxID=6347 RepID=A0A8J1THS1_OWEFU|nr:unnamed protein product [Owenia fusiformis]